MWLVAILALAGLGEPVRRTPASPPIPLRCQNLLYLTYPWTDDSTRALVRGADVVVLAEALGEAPAVGLAAQDSALATLKGPRRWWPPSRFGTRPTGAVAFRVLEV